MNAARLSAMVVKEYHDLKSNMTVLSVLIIPIFMAILFSRMDGEQTYTTSLVLILTVTFVAMYVQAMLLSEEKEKNTLQVLILSPASVADILIGKSIISVVLTVIMFIVSMLILDIRVESPLMLCVILLIAMILFTALGTLVGLISESVVQASVYILPFCFLFGFSPMIQMYFPDGIVADIMKFTPGSFMMEACVGTINGEAFSSYQESVFWLIGWTVVTLVVTFIIFKKKDLSN